MNTLRVASVIPTASGGGIGPVCLYAAKEIARQTGWSVTLVCLHDPPAEAHEENTTFRFVSLGLDQNCPARFLDWLRDNPQDIVITSDVSRIEPAFAFFPPKTVHIVQVHDNLKRYRAVALQSLNTIDGITCVSQHIEEKLRADLIGKDFQGPIRTIHNGAFYPAVISRPPHSGPLRLLYMGRLDAFKGIFDLVAILRKLKKQGTAVILTIVGGENDKLRRAFERYGLEGLVHWTGVIPHEQCYAIAAESDIFLMTSRKEPFGMVTIEAMSMGCVPLAYDVPSGSAEIIEHNENGLLIPLGAIGKWVDEIQKLHLDRSRLGNLSTAAARRARNHFSSQVMGGRLESFVKDVFENAKAHPATRRQGKCPDVIDSESVTRTGYQLVPARIRNFLRNAVGRNATLCHWILDRY